MAGRLSPGQTVALTNSKNEIVGTLEISDIFSWNKEKYLSKVYLTDVPAGMARELKQLCQQGGVAVEETATFSALDMDAFLPDGATDVFLLGTPAPEVVEKVDAKLAKGGSVSVTVPGATSSASAMAPVVAGRVSLSAPSAVPQICWIVFR